jgi:ComEC/Rec2-related protein
LGIIRGRPLFFTALCVTALAVLYLYLRSPVVFILTGILAAALPLPVIALRAGRRIGSYRMFSSILSSLIIAAFCARCGIYYLSAAEAVKKASEPGTVLSGKVVGIRYSTSYSFGCYADLSASSSGDDVVRALVEFQFPAGLRAGDRFFISDFEIADSGFDPDLTADGVFMTVTVPDSFSLSVPESAGSRSLSFDRLNNRLSVMLRERVGGDEGALCSAMLLGDRSGLEDMLKRDFRRSGVSHILAVSGMHVSALTAAAGAALTAAGVRKRLRLVLLSAVAVAYLALLGFPLSAARSVIMVLSVYAGSFIGSGSDGINSLGLAALIILMSDPGSVCDVSFVLTMLSTLGILSLGNFRTGSSTGNEKKAGTLFRACSIRKLSVRGVRGAKKSPVRAALTKVIKAVSSALAVWTAANMLTVLPLSVWFGEFSLMSPVSSVIFGPPAVFLLIASTLTLICFPSGYLSGFFAYYGKLAAGFLIKTAAGISSVSGVAVSLGFGWVPWILVPMTAATAILLCVKLKRKFRFVCFIPFVLSVALFGICYSFEMKSSETPSASFLTQNGNDAFVISGSGTAVVGDISSGSYSVLYEAEKTARGSGAAETEVLILTHCHSRHLSSVRKYLSRNMVRQVWLPDPSGSADASVVLGLVDICDSFGCSCVIYRPGEEVKIFSEWRAVFSGPSGISRSTHPTLWFSISHEEGTGRILYLGSSVWEADFFKVAGQAPGSYIVAGSHGPVAKPFLGRFPDGKRYSYYPAYAGRGLALADPGLLRYFVPPGGHALELMLELPVVSFKDRLDLTLPRD